MGEKRTCGECLNFRQTSEYTGRCTQILTSISAPGSYVKGGMLVPIDGFFCSEWEPIVYYAVDRANGCG